MNTNKIPLIKSPCKDCPFRKDCLEGWLGEKRISEILKQDSFVCHKTTNNDVEGSDNLDRKQCAGFMLLKGSESAFVKLSKSLKLDLGLTGRELVFEHKQDCITHHKNNYDDK